MRELSVLVIGYWLLVFVGLAILGWFSPATTADLSAALRDDKNGLRDDVRGYGYGENALKEALNKSKGMSRRLKPH